MAMFGAQAAPVDFHLGPYKPKAFRTKGGRPACLVNASVTGCPDNTIIAFGGFDQFTDEVYNHVLRLDLSTFTWTLVDNYGEIPSVRMGHTTTYWRDNKLIVFGGENENRVYLADVYLFDITTSTWSQPQISGPSPRGRSRHSVCLHDDKLYVIGGTNGSDVLDDLVYLDLNTMTWSRAWRFVGRFDHTSWVYKNRLYVFGGLTQEMDRTGELCWLDFSEHPTWKSSNGLTPQLSQTNFGFDHRHGRKERHTPNHLVAPSNSQNRFPSPMRQTSNPFAPGSVNAVRFVRGTDVPTETAGNHFHHFCNNTLLDFVTAANTIRDHETSLSALDLDSLVWKHLADGEDVFVNTNYRWHYLAISHDSTTAYLIGCPLEEEGQEPEYLSDILPIDLRRYGVTPERKEGEIGGPGTMGFDLATMFDDASTSDFIVTALNDNYCGDDEEAVWAMVPHPRGSSPSLTSLSTQGGTAMTGITTVSLVNHQSPSSSANSLGSSNTPTDPSISPAIHVHKLILLSRWSHFQRLYAAKMSEFHTGRLHIPEPYSVVKAFLYYLYTDSIAPSPFCSGLATVGGLLVISNIYNIPRLRALCLGRINKELDVDTAAGIWERAGVAGENLLRSKAARYCMMHWGRVVRSEGFRKLSKKAMLELFEEIDVEGRILGGGDLEVGNGGGGIGGGYGFGGETAGEGDDGEGMEIS
ncbi:hypothetical protein AOL_s00193g134 [Orbilia oligospora ATCC 24927]|uniref:BTB domain-containing protein n=2 Tax=Orbilia oligospora TaxID=2813651 RepID=G1XRD5_ARTOA|nr:hypothetical protein AOL_s00193g134 [Orbilia oligospora ATCC 24927]EGX44406.1 hypothetical protein AOL_s00193g134 [Orbilia oligospora ATCC 24927]KAF3276533.1 hypothetical protein TWF970_006132 [Orbilia oligospora]